MRPGIQEQFVGPLEGYADQLPLVDVAGEQRKVTVGMLPEETIIQSRRTG
ncbi:hypothetical protein [Mycolicibacterium agri]|uniref:Uncharacterized protein n=1 Tax=Mycolicibacterium agri TaxID=36811 RepID=A0A7I9VZE5_MYCAG|nr:hypothetical protein MAGR_20200 [Mycolicibacterium agri]